MLQLFLKTAKTLNKNTLFSNAEIKITLSIIQKLGNAKNLLYIFIYVAKKSTRNLFILIFLLAAVIVRVIHIALYNLETMGWICCYDA